MTATTINEVEVEFCDYPDSQGIIIRDREESFFLKCDRSDIEDWALSNGEEGSDFTYEKEWQDNFPDRGYYESVKTLIEDAFDSQVRDYAFAFRSEWENTTEH